MGGPMGTLGRLRSIVPVRQPRLASLQAPKKPVVVQRIRLRNRFRLRNVLIGTVVFYVSYQVYTTVVFSPLYAWLEEEEKHLTPRQLKELSEEDLDTFIPLPLTMRSVQPPPYSGQDPEWQEFVRISRDMPYQERMRSTLTSTIVQQLTINKLLVMKMGKPVKVRRSWLDIYFPYQPPLEFVRSGILITDDSIGIAERPVDSGLANMTTRVLWPVAVANGAWVTLQTVAQLHYQQIRRMLGYETTTKPIFGIPANAPKTAGLPPGAPPYGPLQQNPEIQRMLQQVRQQSTKRPQDIKDPAAMAASQAQGGSGAGALGTASPSATEAGNVMTESFPGQNFVKQAMAHGWMALVKKWKRPEIPPRGSVIVSGMVEVETPKAFVVLDVVAYWDPKARAYHHRSTVLRFRRTQLKEQRPMR